jgi:hypothetical protein
MIFGAVLITCLLTSVFWAIFFVWLDKGLVEANKQLVRLEKDSKAWLEYRNRLANENSNLKTAHATKMNDMLVHLSKINEHLVSLDDLRSQKIC